MFTISKNSNKIGFGSLLNGRRATMASSCAAASPLGSGDGAEVYSRTRTSRSKGSPFLASQRSELKAEVIALKRKRIVDAARRLFYEKGYERTNLDDIAERLQVTKPFIYSYYKNKNELLHEIAQQCISECLEAQSRILASKASTADKLARIVEEVARIIIDNQAN